MKKNIYQRRPQIEHENRPEHAQFVAARNIKASAFQFRQQGAVLVISLVALVVTTMLVLSAFRSAVIELKIGGASQVNMKNLANADMGLASIVNANAGQFGHGKRCDNQAATTSTYDCRSPNVPDGRVDVNIVEFACVDYCAAGTGNQCGSSGNLQAAFIDINATAQSNTGSSNSVTIHQGVRTLLLPGGCNS